MATLSFRFHYSFTVSKPRYWGSLFPVVLVENGVKAAKITLTLIPARVILSPVV